MKVAAASVMTADIPNVRDFWSGLVDSVGPICPADRKVIMFFCHEFHKNKRKTFEIFVLFPRFLPV